MKIVDLLTNARALIAEESNTTYRRDGRATATGHTKMAIYRDGLGAIVDVRAAATCFCSVGAVLGALGCDAESTVDGLIPGNHGPVATKEERRQFFLGVDYLNNAAMAILPNKALGSCAAMTLNDKADHKAVLAMFDLAIKNARRRHKNGKRYAAGTNSKPAVSK